MKKFILVGMAMIFTMATHAQNTLQLYIKTSTGETLSNASVSISSLKRTVIADSTGSAILSNIPQGNYTVTITHIGYEEEELKMEFPSSSNRMQQVILRPGDEEEEEEVTVISTRSSRTIAEIPTRIETISAEELNEKITMQPANVRMVLNESTGIQTQQTSAASANSSIRIQGLDGKYTQLLKDGFPLYAGYSGGLSLVQTPPLDLKRVEVIKGSASTLYGGGAIAGLINFITKEPTEKRELSFLMNATSRGGLDLSGYYAKRSAKTGITLLASRNTQKAFDINKDGLSEMPDNVLYNINPRLFFYISPTATLSFGANAGIENRTGGDMLVLDRKATADHSYFERNKSNRFSTQLKFEKKYSTDKVLSLKNSVGYFNRSILKPNYLFEGRQLSVFSELNYLLKVKRSEWIFGTDMRAENFQQKNKAAYPLDDKSFIAGAFVQNNFKATDKFILESGLRTDLATGKNVFFLPRVAAMYRFTPKLSMRINGGLGYKMPGIFSEEAEEKGFKNIEPLDTKTTKPERSAGTNFDVNYKTQLFDRIQFSINQMFFYTRISSPLVLNGNPLPNGNMAFISAKGHVESRGWETNLKFKYRVVSFYLGYTYTDAQEHFNSKTAALPLSAKHRIYSTIMYEAEKDLRIGYELFYTGKQSLNSGAKTSDYTVMGISAEKFFRHFNLFVNAENFTDRRQSRYESVYTGSIQNPQFKEIWAPTDGFIFNAGIKLVLGKKEMP